MDEQQRALNEWAEERAKGVRAVMNDMGPRLRGMPFDEAEKRLLAAFREREVFVGREMVSTMARMAADPWAWVKQPFKTARRDREDAGMADAESHRYQAESEEVSRRVDAVLDSESNPLDEWSFSAHRTYDGMTYEVVIRPYSDALAERIRRGVVPFEVHVRPQ